MFNQFIRGFKVRGQQECRAVGKAHMPLNDARPAIEVDPDTFTVRIDGEVWHEQPATELPMAQRYFLF